MTRRRSYGALAAVGVAVAVALVLLAGPTGPVSDPPAEPSESMGARDAPSLPTLATKTRPAEAPASSSAAVRGPPPPPPPDDRSLARSKRVDVAVTVLDPAGRPVVGALVRIGSESANTRADGVARLKTYSRSLHATVLPPPDRDDILPASMLPIDSVATVLRLEVAHTVSGVVKDAAGKPDADAFIAWRTREKPWSGKRVDYDGTFTIDRLPKGSVEIRALWHPVPPEPDGPGIEVATGTRGHVLVSDGGVDLKIRIEDWPPGATATLYLDSVEAGRWREDEGKSAVGPTGEVVFHGIRRGADYAVWLSPLVDGKTLLRGGLRGGDDVVRLRLSPAGALKVRFVPLHDLFVSTARLSGVPVPDQRPHDRAIPDEEWTIEEVPAGRHVLELSGYAGDPPRTHRATVEVDVPGTVLVRLEPAPEPEAPQPRWGR